MKGLALVPLTLSLSLVLQLFQERLCRAGLLHGTFHSLHVSNSTDSSGFVFVERYKSKTKIVTDTETNTTINTRSCSQCAVICLQDRAQKNQTISSVCGAYSCCRRNVELSCDFYAIGGASLATSLPEKAVLYLFQATDVFHPISIEGRLYSIYLSSVKKTYEEARTHCVSLGGYLLHFDSLDEYQAVRMVTAGTSKARAYVGANDIAVRNRWVSERDGAVLAGSVWVWNKNEPDNLWGRESCAALDLGLLLLEDVDCARLEAFLCQRDWEGQL